MSDKPNFLLTGSAVAYFAAALALLFAADELQAAAGVAPTALSTTVFQLLGGALLGYAMLNWMSRYSLIGGIYGRALVVANFAHTATAALMLGHLARRVAMTPALALALAAYATLAIAFGAKLFGGPKSSPTQ